MFNNSSSVVGGGGGNGQAPSGLLPNGNPFAMPQSHFIEEEEDYSPNNQEENGDPSYFNANNESAPSGV